MRNTQRQANKRKLTQRHYDGFAFFGCLTLISLIVVMCDDIKDMEQAKKPRIAKIENIAIETIPYPRRKPYELVILNSLQTFEVLNDNTPVNIKRAGPPQLNR